MQTYSEFRPTAFDPSGLDTNRQNWLVSPVSRTRDSDILTESNFSSALESLGGESDTVEVHRLGHWGSGWFEIITIDPADVKRVSIASNLKSALADYPLLNDENFSRREYDAAIEAIQQQSPLSASLSPETASEVFSWLSRNEPRELENLDDTGAFPDSDAIKRALLSVAPEQFDIYELAEMLEDDDGDYPDVVSELLDTVSRGKRQLLEYCRRMPEYATKATEAHAETVEAIRFEMLDMVTDVE